MIEVPTWLFILGALGLLSLGGIIGMFIMAKIAASKPHSHGKIERPYPWPDPPDDAENFQKEGGDGC